MIYFLKLKKKGYNMANTIRKLPLKITLPEGYEATNKQFEEGRLVVLKNEETQKYYLGRIDSNVNTRGMEIFVFKNTASISPIKIDDGVLILKGEAQTLFAQDASGNAYISNIIFTESDTKKYYDAECNELLPNQVSFYREVKDKFETSKNYKEASSIFENQALTKEEQKIVSRFSDILMRDSYFESNAIFADIINNHQSDMEKIENRCAKYAPASRLSY